MSIYALAKYFYVLKYANPGTITDIKTELDKEGKTRFKYAFMSLKACIDGWKHLRKVLVVDGTHMFGKYKGVLLSASGQDADYRAFPIAFAVVDSENSDSWKWFFERCAAIFAAKDRWYPRAHHGICLEHLKRNVGEKYKGLQHNDMVPSAGEAFKVAEFEKLYELIKLTDWRCWNYLEKIDRKLWTHSHFEGKRYNLMTSNIAESLNHALLPARDSPIVALMEFIRRMLTRWFESRRCKIKYHVKDTWSETVKGIILPVPNPEDIHIPADILKLQLFPPMTKRTKGRPDIKTKLSAGEVPEGPRKKKKANKCSRCYKEGHKKTTCREPVP
ncbi:uncharacterized protein LOC106355478 [Brassica napus]|uniref:uncharacterized protein LOC106355478 n=1 Tax=Brassica napus TaxID=3708 RepID=UPI0006AB5221|nr:uncharacterized protein LOC106355478 [Brassica napus]